MEHKNLANRTAPETAQRDEVKHRSRTPISSKVANSRNVGALRRYRSQVISVIDVLEELLGHRKDTRAACARAKGTQTREPFELAFMMLSQNHSAREIMG
jgi:hypothetical protein